MANAINSELFDVPNPFFSSPDVCPRHSLPNVLYLIAAINGISYLRDARVAEVMTLIRGMAKAWHPDGSRGITGTRFDGSIAFATSEPAALTVPKD